MSEAVNTQDENLAPAPAPTSGFSFIRQGDHAAQDLDWEKGPDQVRKALAEALGARNVAFLLGAGCSSMVVDDKERGISTMLPLAREFCAAPEGAEPWVFDASERSCLAGYGLSLEGEYARNLERLMETLHALRFVLQAVESAQLTEVVVPDLDKLLAPLRKSTTGPHALP